MNIANLPISRLRPVTLLMFLLATNATFVTVCQSTHSADVPQMGLPLAGRWRSDSLTVYGFGEWKNAASIQVAISQDGKEATLYLCDVNGRLRIAPDSKPAFVTDKQMSFGPIGSALIFDYRRAGDQLKMTSLSGRIVAILRPIAIE